MLIKLPRGPCTLTLAAPDASALFTVTLCDSETPTTLANKLRSLSDYIRSASQKKYGVPNMNLYCETSERHCD